MTELRIANEEWLRYFTEKEEEAVMEVVGVVNRKISELEEVAERQSTKLREYEEVARERMREEALKEEEEESD